MSDETAAAFELYCRDPVVKRALDRAKDTISLDLLRDAFMHGASYAVARRKAEHGDKK